MAGAAHCAAIKRLFKPFYQEIVLSPIQEDKEGSEGFPPAAIIMMVNDCRQPFFTVHCNEIVDM